MKTVYRDSHVHLLVQKKPFPRWDFKVRPAANVLPVTADGKILVMHEQKGSTGRWIWGFPGGIVEPGETPVQGARRECEEELGLRPGRMKKLTVVKTDFPDTQVTFFLGFDLRKVAAKHWESEKIGQVKRVSLKQLEHLARRGEIHDPRMVVAVLALVRQPDLLRSK
ncbi:MAG: NUDIX hydrolase [Candidatus Kerfeldbacteria bacterium]|nr:NUDIX hydrolase [Candidatus Kerfeldbacteria bacterium]